jgi:hypothetical protein
VTFDPQEGTQIQPVSVNSFGVVVGEVYLLTPPYTTSFLRLPDGTMSAPDFYPTSINDRGLIIGGGGESITLREQDGKEIVLTPPRPWIRVQPIAINDKGWIIGSVYDANDQASGFIWKPAN